MFKVITRVSWKNEPQQIDLVGMKNIFGAYPVVSKKFFQDLVHNIEKNKTYYAEGGLRTLVFNNKPYEPHDWIFLWAEDFKERIFWILFSRSGTLGGQGAIAAVGPVDFAGFLKTTGKEAIVPTLTLLNSPEKMKSVAVIVSYPSEAKKARQKIASKPELEKFRNWISQLKQTPNPKGQWFPEFEPVCPVCHERLLGVKDIRIGFTQFLCPKCGYQNSEFKQ